VFRGFFVSGRPVTVLASPGFLGVSFEVSASLSGGTSLSRGGQEHKEPLTNVEIQKAKPGPTPAKLTDGRGLYLLVTPAGSKLWRWKFRFEGKEKLMAVGSYPDVSLAQARDKVDEARKLLAMGTDPMATRKTEKIARRLAVEDTFAAVAKK
jgi:hypothetical protein